MTQGEQNDTSELPEGMPYTLEWEFYGYPLLPFDEGEWCECYGRVQPVKNGKCAVCGNGYDECQEDVLIDEPINIPPIKTVQATMTVKRIIYLNGGE